MCVCVFDEWNGLHCARTANAFECMAFEHFFNLANDFLCIVAVGRNNSIGRIIMSNGFGFIQVNISKSQNKSEDKQ